MTPRMVLQLVVMLWIITHASADFFANRGRGKPFNCQLCTAGWMMLATAIARATVVVVDAYPRYDGYGYWVTEPLVWWAGSVWIEALYNRLTTFIR